MKFLNAYFEQKFPTLVVLGLMLEAGDFLQFDYLASRELRLAHATWSQTISALSTDWLLAFLFIALALLYGRIPSIRRGLQTAAVGGALLGIYRTSTGQIGVVSYWGIFHGDLFAISSVSSIGLIVIGALALLDHFISKPERTSQR